MNTRDLVIGLAALQLGKTDTTRLANTYQTYLAQGAADWLTNLTATGALSPDDAREIAAFAQQLVRACGNNEQAALDVLGGIEKARETFRLQRASRCLFREPVKNPLYCLNQTIETIPLSTGYFNSQSPRGPQDVLFGVRRAAL